MVSVKEKYSKCVYIKHYTVLNLSVKISHNMLT